MVEPGTESRCASVGSSGEEACHLGERKVPAPVPPARASRAWQSSCQACRAAGMGGEGLVDHSRGGGSGHLFSKGSHAPLRLPDSSLWCWCGEGGGLQHESLRLKWNPGSR